MDIGFDTIGNATLIVYDRGPVLVTDPWLDGEPYFGSWTLSHDIPEEQQAAVSAARFVWFSHGHPDHLNWPSLDRFRNATVLLADHVGGRIATALRDEGFQVSVLPDRTWHQLSERVRVMTIADYNQDSILLVDVGGRLVLDLNDARDRGWGHTVRSIVKRYDVSFLMQLSGFGDADMINLFDEDGARIPPEASFRDPVGKKIAWLAGKYGVRYFVPFSSMHKYQREDSIWAEEHTTKLADYASGFVSQQSELLPAFVRYDAAADVATPIDPPQRAPEVVAPAKYGDNWTDTLAPEDVQKLRDYFTRMEHLREAFAFVAFEVGGATHTVDLGPPSLKRGFTFAVPRHSLMTAINYEIFDDLLIGNFMRTTVHGNASPDALYPDFTPFVGKYADNGYARSEAELRAYFAAYRGRAPLEYFRHRMARQSAAVVRRMLPPGSRARAAFYTATTRFRGR